ncbi:MAG: glycosyltransferase family 4 protein [Chloroflexi bacterium]|nr:glycosyltransferase family 4 protein [Chloroflexota bacterium]
MIIEALVAMKILIISKALTAATYHRKLELIAAEPDVELTAIVPPMWFEPGVGEYPLEVQTPRNYRMHVVPLGHNGHHHTFWWQGLGKLIAAEQPDILHADEEAFNLATFQAFWHARKTKAKLCFYNWADVARRYPPPFSFFERYSYRHAAHAIAGNHLAKQLIRDHGYTGPISVIPQFGVDETIFRPAPEPLPAKPFVVGFFGRLMRSKGVLDLLAALERLPSDIHCRLIGKGDLSSEVEQRIAKAPLAGRVTLEPLIPSSAMPEAMRSVHAYVLPSRTTPNWKEQFGRVLIEAMACGVPVIGSDSGEIPHVIDTAGLVFPEGDVAALAEAIHKLYLDEKYRQTIAEAGRQRALSHYTQASIAQQHLAVYRSMR